ncbi:hypothetical protein E6C76_05585 [Pseudothauera nasutitermitis]|uniref:Uncharacterized protein n=1 Tax=Pseudothauera nasutitermitis TaxID=2565930 RepID=A0A4S4B298_9RHOO|nr:hypothetical protein [Pseudothauera nasutitermitis]THF66315.1 hypothetical protein E6C76_05585 [Pseudothauera nasutitermitis]
MSGARRTLGYEATPAFHIPLSFFLAATLFGVGAGLFLLFHPDALDSRWTPGALALTHLITAGFMLLTMLGALLQILPVVAGASIPAVRPVAIGVHALVSTGACSLAWGFMAGSPAALQAGGGLLGGGLLLFLGAAVLGLRRSEASQTTGRDLRIALIGLAATAVLGILLVLVLSRGLALPFAFGPLITLHVAWGLLGWGGALLAATSWVVIPMFQITPEYPRWLTRFWAPLVLAVLGAWTAFDLLGNELPAWAGSMIPMALTALFALTTLHLMRRTRRPNPDASFRTMQLAMACLLGGALCTLVAILRDEAFWPLAAGILILHGGFVSAITAMLYKIVPFLAWLHLTQARIKAPHMKKLLPDLPMRRQLRLHAITLAALLGAAVVNWNGATRLAGALVALEFGWLAANLLGTVQRWRLTRQEAG